MTKHLDRAASARLLPDDAAIPNRLLAALPRTDYLRMLPELKTVPITVKQVLHKHGELVRHVYFPNSVVCSMTTVMNNGSMVEVATIGQEGMVGINAFLGDDVTPGATMVQVGNGTAVRMSLAAFRREVRRTGAFQVLINRYAQALVATMMQSVACNTLHSLRQRCARWLLSTQDRVEGNEFGLSHEFLAIMLGAQRPTVTIVAGTLQKAGLIRYRHGRVMVLDRKGLERESCECYRTIRGHFERLQL
jgi:CRP-like cAMP-binding protein